MTNSRGRGKQKTNWLREHAAINDDATVDEVKKSDRYSNGTLALRLEQNTEKSPCFHRVREQALQ